MVRLIVLSSDHMGRNSEESNDRDEKRFRRHQVHQEALPPAQCRTSSVSFLSSPVCIGILVTFLEGMLRT